MSVLEVFLSEVSGFANMVTACTPCMLEMLYSKGLSHMRIDIHIFVCAYLYILYIKKHMYI